MANQRENPLLRLGCGQVEGGDPLAVVADPPDPAFAGDRNGRYPHTRPPNMNQFTILLSQ
jgi:hypothetical protein